MKKYLQKFMKKEKTEEKEEKIFEEPIIEVENACPLCKGKVKGNEKKRYYCKHCNMLFRKEDLLWT